MPSSFIQFAPFPVSKLSDIELGIMLREVASDFPFSGNNYASEILLEAAIRKEALDAK